MSTLIGIIEALGIILSLALILAAAVLSQVHLRDQRWIALKKMAQAGMAGMISGLIVAFIASLLLSFVLTYVSSHLVHDGYTSCLNTIGNNICTAPYWDSAFFDIYIVGAFLGAGVGITVYELRARAARTTSLTTHSRRKP